MLSSGAARSAVLSDSLYSIATVNALYACVTHDTHIVAPSAVLWNAVPYGLRGALYKGAGIRCCFFICGPREPDARRAVSEPGDCGHLKQMWKPHVRSKLVVLVVVTGRQGSSQRDSNPSDQAVTTWDYRRKFRSQTSDNMDRWKAEQGRGRGKRKIRRKKSRRERV